MQSGYRSVDYQTKLYNNKTQYYRDKGYDEATAKEKAAAKPSYTYHTVKRGETLSKIARKYRGVTIADIQKANGISGSAIQAGQKLKIPRK